MTTNNVQAASSSFLSAETPSPDVNAQRQRSFNRAAMRGDSPRMASLHRSGSADTDYTMSRDVNQYFDQRDTSPIQARSPGSYSALHSPNSLRRGLPSASSGAYRRPSSSSASQTGALRRDSNSRRLSNDSSVMGSFASAAASPSSQPSTPKTKSTSSRSRILASSAAALEGSPPWQQQRLGEAALNRSMSPLPIQQSQRMRNMSGSTIGSQSVMERKKRMASASGSYAGSTYDEGMNDAASMSGVSIRTNAEPTYSNSDQASIYSTRSSSNSQQRRRGQSSADEYQISEKAFVQGRTNSASNLDTEQKSERRAPRNESSAVMHPVSASIKDRFFSLRKDKRVKDDDGTSVVPDQEQAPTTFHRNFARKTSSQAASINPQTYLDEMESPRTLRKDLPSSRYEPSKLSTPTIATSHLPESQSEPILPASSTTTAHDEVDEHEHTHDEVAAYAEQDDTEDDNHVARGGNAYASDVRRGMPQRGHSKSSASISSMASYTSHVSNGSVPARTSSLKQIRVPNINAVAAPIGSPAGSSYKSVPPSPVIASSISHDEGFHRAASSLAHTNSNRASWRLSTLSTAAAGQSGAGALAAIRARFGEPTNDESRGGQASEKEVPLSAAEGNQSKVSEESVEMMAETDASAELSHAALNGGSMPPVRAEPTEIPKRPATTKMEPLRPVKSPLRGRNSSGAEAVTVSPLAKSQRDLIAAPEQTNSKQLSPMSPPRKSLEDMGIGSALYASESHSSIGSGVQLTPSSSQLPLQRQRSRTSTSSRSAQRGDILTHGDESQLSLVTDDGTQVGHGSIMSASDAKTKRYNTLRRMTPPTLFGSKSSSKSHSQQDSVGSMEGRQRTPSADGPLAAVGQRKKSIWRLGLGKNDGQDGSGEDNKAPSPLPAVPTLPSASSSPKLGGMLTIRSRKSDPQAERPPIKRFFDSSPNITKDVRNAKVKGGLKDSPSITSLDQHYKDLVSNTTPTSDVRSVDKLPSQKAKVQAKRWNAIRELIETERTYATDLGIVRDVYLIRAKTMAGLPAASPLHTPLTSYGTPVIPSPSLGTPSSAPSTQASFATKRGAVSPLITSQSARQQLQPDPQGAGQGASSGASVPSATSSSGNPSNRSSTYTTSSHTSSEYSFHWPPNGSSLPGTPSVGATSSTHKNASLHAASPAPSVQQFKPNNGNLTKIQTASVLSAPLPVSSEAPLSASDMRVIFAHLESCLALALETSSVLQTAAGLGDREDLDNESNVMLDKQDDAIGQAFLMLMPRIEVVYTAYCSRHEAGMQRLQEVLAASPKAVSFFRECTEIARKMTTAWDLGSLLIKPVQRVLKYPLLLRQILSATDVKHRDHANLVEALHNMQNVADKINQVKRRRDLADYLITGRDRDGRAVGQSTLTTSQSVKGKKKGGGLTPRTSNTGVGDDTLMSDEALEMAAEEYNEILKKFEALQSRVAIFGRQCGGWSHSLRESYYIQLRIVGSLRHIYSLRMVESDAGMPRPHAPSSAEDAVLATYMDVLKTVINRSWRQMDSEIRSAILPMTFKIESMFDAPRSVIVKRDEREADYVRSRQMLAQGGANAKMVDRKMIESANGFVALQSQLIDELPAFVQGVQVLLDVGVQAFARLQAAHFDEVKNLTLEFWSEQAGHADEVDMVGVDDDDMLNVGPTLRNVNPIRAFWESHQPFSQWGESLLISRRESELQAFADESELAHRGNVNGEEDSRPSNSTRGNVTPTVSVAHEDLGIFRSPFLGQDEATMMAGGSEEKGPRLSRQNGLGLVHSGSNADSVNGGLPRRPSSGGVAGLMRSISGTFSRDTTPSPSIEAVPPLPEKAGTMIRQHRDAVIETESSISAEPPSLPSLVFRDDGSDGFFILNSPVSFLDAVLKEPYDKSPMIAPADAANANVRRNGIVEQDLSVLSSLSSNDEGDDSTRESSFASLTDPTESVAGPATTRTDSSNYNAAQKPLSKTESSKSLSVPTTGMSHQAPQRHKIKALFQCVALHDAKDRSNSASSAAALNHLGWPFVQYRCGDTFRVLSTDATGAEALLFGRLDKTGEMGWVEKANFSGGRQGTSRGAAAP